MICPLMSLRAETTDGASVVEECREEGCAWYCVGEKCCAIKLIAIQTIKIEEGI